MVDVSLSGLPATGTPELVQAAAAQNPPSITTTAQAGTVGFPELLIAAVIVSAGIYYAYTVDSRAGWALAILIVLVIAFGYQSFGNQLIQILDITKGGTVLPNPTIPNPGNAISNT